jgi:hypothetical protein
MGFLIRAANLPAVFHCDDAAAFRALRVQSTSTSLNGPDAQTTLNGVTMRKINTETAIIRRKLIIRPPRLATGYVQDSPQDSLAAR